MASKRKRKRSKRKAHKRSYLAEMVTHLPPVVMRDRRAPKGGARNRQRDYLAGDY